MLTKIKNALSYKKGLAHTIVIGIITLLFGILGWLVGALAGCVCSLGLETYEFRKNRADKDVTDVYYDVAGVIIGVLILLIL